MSRSATLLLFSSALWFAAAYLFARRIGPIWDGVTRKYVADLSPLLRALSFDQQAQDKYLRWWGIAMAATFLFFAIPLQLAIVGLGMTYLVFVAPRYLLQALIAKRRAALRDQMVRCAIALSNTTRAGLSLAEGMAVVAAESPDPLGRELRRIAADYKAGRPLAQALREVQVRLNLESFTLFASAVIICMERGGRVTYALERLGEGLQELQRLERKLEVDTASGRRLALVLGAFPFFFMAGFWVLDAESIGVLFGTVAGQCVLLLMGAIIYGAVVWCLKILQVDF